MDEKRIQQLSQAFEDVLKTPLYSRQEKEDRVKKYLDEGFCVFGFWGMETFIHNVHKVEKKKPIGLPLDWPNLKKPDNEAFLNYQWRGWGIVTGRESGITVLDFDDSTEYKKLIQSCPELMLCRTILTNKGIHIYFKYDPEIPTATNVLSILKGVDVRNDGGIAFCNPTQYEKIDETLITYLDAGGEIQEMPQFLKDDIHKTMQTKNKSTKVYIFGSLE